MGEPFGVCLVGGVKGGLAVLEDDGVVPVVEIGGPEVADPGVVVDLVVPVEEVATPRPGVFDRVEPVGVVGPVLEGLEVALDERV